MNPLFGLAHSPVFLAFAVLLLGLCVGSFLNVVVHRLPLMLERDWRRECRSLLSLDPEPETAPLSLVAPRSRCPSCQAPIKAWHNIPVVSWIALRGRCAACAAPISAQYPLVEAACGALSLACALKFGWSPALAGALLLTWALLALTMIDLRTQLLPDSITLPLLWAGLLLSLFAVFTRPAPAIIGAAAGYLSLWSVYHVFRLVTGKEGMGYGDFKLLAALGAWFGWQALPLIVLLSSLAGAVIGLGLIALRRHDRNVPIPFGPFLAAAGWLMLIAGPELTQAWMRFTTA